VQGAPTFLDLIDDLLGELQGYVVDNDRGAPRSEEVSVAGWMTRGINVPWPATKGSSENLRSTYTLTSASDQDDLVIEADWAG
jgi:hypothetical protein